MTSFLPSMRGRSGHAGVAKRIRGRRTSRRDRLASPVVLSRGVLGAGDRIWWSHASTVSLLIRRKVRDSRGRARLAVAARTTHRRGRPGNRMNASPFETPPYRSLPTAFAAEDALIFGLSVRAGGPTSPACRMEHAPGPLRAFPAAARSAPPHRGASCFSRRGA